MKVYSVPKGFEYEIDFKNYNFAREQAREVEHKAKLKEWLVTNGYNGPLTGKILALPMGDGAACYMYADHPKKPFLMHLPYGDAWHSPLVKDMTKAAVLKRLVDEDPVKSIFAANAG